MKLPSPSDYANHCFRRNRASVESEYVKLIQFIADKGARIQIRKRSKAATKDQ